MRDSHDSVHQSGKAWREQALALRRQGLTYREVGKAMGVSRERVRQLVVYAEAEERRRQMEER